MVTDEKGRAAAIAATDYPADVWQRERMVDKILTAYLSTNRTAPTEAPPDTALLVELEALARWLCREGVGSNAVVVEKAITALRASRIRGVEGWRDALRDAKTTLEYYATLTGENGRPARDALDALQRNYGL